jgi:hypothetical protein
MARLRVEIDCETLQRLIEDAGRELRPVSMQAAVILRRALGLPFPFASQLAAKPNERLDEGRLE